MKKTRADASGLVIEPRNKHGIIRVRADGHMYPFKYETAAEFLALYKKAARGVHFDFAPAEWNGQSIQLSPVEQSRLLRRVTLHWMYFFHMNKQPIQITPGELAHPYTYDIVRQIVGEHFGHGSPAAMALAGKITGMSADEFAGWARRYDDLMDRF